MRTHLLPKTPLKAVSRGDGQASNTQAGVLRLEKVIFEKGKFATLKVFLLQQKNEVATASVLGKIANVEPLTVKRSLPGEKNEAVPVLPIASFLAAYLGIIAGMVSLNAWLDKKYKRARRMKVQKFLNTHKDLTPEQQAIVAAYRSRWKSGLSRIVRQLAAGDDVLNLKITSGKKLQLFENTP